MSDSPRVTIVYEAGDDGWIVASVPEVAGVHSQGRTREEARVNVVRALRGMLELRFGQGPSVESEPAQTNALGEPLVDLYGTPWGSILTTSDEEILTLTGAPTVLFPAGIPDIE